MKHLSPLKSLNRAGIECFFFIPAEQIERDPLPNLDMVADSNGVPSTLVIRELMTRPGALWYQAFVTKHTLQYKGAGELTRSGMRYEHLLSGLVGKVTPEVAAILAQFHEQRFVIIYQDRNQYLRLIGSKDYGLEFSFSEDSGRVPGDLNHTSFQFKGQSKFPAYFYDGNLADTLAGLQETDFGDVTVPTAARVLADGITLRILAS
jgi:hypothetical protein